MAGWCLIPDKADAGPGGLGRADAFVATAVAFFLVEIGEKTQIATVVLAARYDRLIAVTAGTTAGMMLANVPVVLLATPSHEPCRSGWRAPWLAVRSRFSVR